MTSVRTLYSPLSGRDFIKEAFLRSPIGSCRISLRPIGFSAVTKSRNNKSNNIVICWKYEEDFIVKRSLVISNPLCKNCKVENEGTVGWAISNQGNGKKTNKPLLLSTTEVYKLSMS